MNLTVCMFIVLFVALAVIIIAGKGDWMIAGYNTASEKERKQVNIKRLRLLIAILLFLVAAAMPLLLLDNAAGGIFFSEIVMAAGVVVIILANTWAMKK